MRQKKLVPKRRFAGFDGEWEEVSLEDTVDISTNMVDPRDDEYNELWHIGPGNIESFTGKLLDNVMKVKYSNLISGKFHFYKDDIIYGKINPQLAKYTMAKSEGLASADAYVLNSKNNIEQTFLYYVIQTYEFYKYTVSVSSRTGMPKINREELNVYNFNAPIFKEQQKIGHFFNQLDEMIATQQQKVEKTKALKSAYLAEMFPAEGERVPKRRFAGFTGEWEERVLSNIAPDISDGDWIEKEHIFNQGEYRIIQTGNLGVGEFLDKEKSVKYFYQKDFEQLKANEIFAGDILISRLAEPAGRAIILPDTGIRMVTAVDVTVIRPDENFDSIFLMTQMNSEKVLNKVNEEVSGTSHKRISRKNLERTALMVPSLEEQQKIGQFFKQLDNKITNTERKLEKLKATKQAYLQEMFV